MADVAPINWTNTMTLLSVAILVGTELVGAGAAAGWAIGGLFQLGETFTRAVGRRAHSLGSDRALLFSARGGRARADPRLAGRALAANSPTIARCWNANDGNPIGEARSWSIWTER